MPATRLTQQDIFEIEEQRELRARRRRALASGLVGLLLLFVALQASAACQPATSRSGSEGGFSSLGAASARLVASRDGRHARLVTPHRLLPGAKLVVQADLSGGWRDLHAPVVVDARGMFERPAISLPAAPSAGPVVPLRVVIHTDEGAEHVLCPRIELGAWANDSVLEAFR